jgi:hypothetical protein
MANGTTPLEAPPTVDYRAWDWFAIILLLGFFGIVVLTFFKAPLLSEGSINQIIGGMLVWIGMIVGYKWGSSAGSHAKDNTIAQLARKP